MSATYHLQKAVMAALLQDGPLASLLGAHRVFDSVPYNQPFPFIVAGEITSTDWDTGSERGFEHTFVLHIWSRSGGKMQTFEVASAVYEALHERALTVEQHDLVNLRHQTTDVRREDDGETYHGVMRFRAVTEPKMQSS